MSGTTANPGRILAIDPTPRGFGFIVLEGPATLVEWGVKATRTDKQARTLDKVDGLIRQYQPEIIVLEDYAGKGSRRCHRIEDLIKSARRLADEKHIRDRVVAPERVKKVFRAFGALTKHQIARVIAKQLPELIPWLPRYRKPWMSEDYRMAIFDAAALAITYLFIRPVRIRLTPPE